MVRRLSCFASAVLAIGVAGAASAQTPATPAPVTPPGTPPAGPSPDAGVTDRDILLRAKIITEDRDAGTLVAEGDVEVRVGNRSLFADRLVWDQTQQSMRAQGRVQILDAVNSIQFADEIEVDEDFRNGFATRFSARLPKNALITASAAVRTDGTLNALEQVIYTGCKVCENSGSEPTWSLRARRAVQNTETQMISYQDAVLEIKGIPILYVPYFAHPDPTSERRSGLLTPDAGVSSRLGPYYEQPIHIVFSPSHDLTVSPMLSANVAPLIKATYRKRFFSGQIIADGSFTYEQEFNSDGDKFGDEEWRSHLYASGRFDLNEHWTWGFGVERQTDDLYDWRYDIDGENDRRGIYSSQPRQLLSQVYSTGQHEDFYFEAGLLSFQGLRASDRDAQLPRVAPTVFAEKIFDLGAGGHITTDFSAVALFRDEPALLPNGDTPLDTARASTSATWDSRHIVGPGLVLEPFAMGRGDVYHIDDGTSVETIGRGLGIAGAQVSLPFIRRGKTMDIIVEPVVMAAYGTEDANDPRIPNEDSLLFEADESNLFRPDVVSNYDLWEGGARAAAGLSATARFGAGMEVSGLFGRRWRQEADPAFSALSNLSGETSDYVANVKANFGSNLTTAVRMRLDDDFNVKRVDVDANGSLWRLDGRARYYKVSSNSAGLEDEGIVASGALRFTDRWAAIYRQERNITQERDMRFSLGLAYQDDCSYFSLSYERSGASDRSLGPSESLRFRFVLTGLGGVSDDGFGR